MKKRKEQALNISLHFDSTTDFYLILPEKNFYKYDGKKIFNILGKHTRLSLFKYYYVVNLPQLPSIF